MRVMTTFLRLSTTSWYLTGGSLQLFCSVLSLLEASVISSSSAISSASGWSKVDNYTEKNRCIGIVVDGPGSCYCSPVAEIHCRDLTAVPEFRRNGTQYSVAYFDQQRISSIPPAAFRHLRASRITLNFNPIGAGLSEDALRGLDKSVRELELGACQLTELPDTLLNGVSKLRRLHLWANRIRSIPGGFFGGADELHELALWGNELEELDALSLGGMWNLRRLDLDHNRLTTISKDAFRHLLELHSLRLNNNLVEAIYAETFVYMESLKSLSLDRNRISYLHERAFVGLSTLISLSLSGNNISYLPNELFAPLVNLIVLRLDSNRIEYVWPLTFIGLGELRRLDLSCNYIGVLPDGALRHSHKLQRVMLDNNRLNTLRHCSLATSADDMSPYLRTLSLSGNPLVCDCSVAWLVHGVRKPATVWWPACRGGRRDNQTNVLRHHSYHGLTQDTCSEQSSHNCPFNI